MEKYYITTPIYYPSGNPHIGHCYTTVACDTVARYKRAKGYDVMFLTGTDDHGQKIEEKAKEAGKEPQQYVDEVVANFSKLWDFMNISSDRFVRTTDEYHIKTVQEVFKKLYDRGYIYKGEYTGKYCTPCESFWTESQLVDGKCPDCGREVKDAKEDAYFFKLSAFEKQLEDLLTKTDFLQPQSRVNEMVNNFIKPGLADLCVSRTSFTWGVPVPLDPSHVVYVWVDALSNYVSALGLYNDAYQDFEKYWPADVHMMAKEIVRFHSLVWPAMLMALDIPVPSKIYGHGWITFDGAKMSKSKGNVIDPYILGSRYGVDAIRYYLLRELPFGGDASFSNENMFKRINFDLANDLGNLVSRTVAMTIKYFDGTLLEEKQYEEMDDELIQRVIALKEKVETNLDSMQFSSALQEVFTTVSYINKYIDLTEPWILAKDDALKARLSTVLYNLLESIRCVSVLLHPFMPSSMEKIYDQIQVSGHEIEWDSSNQFKTLKSCATVKKGDVIFPRIDIPKEMEYLESLAPVIEEPKEVIPEITIDDFSKVNMEVGTIESCKVHPDANKLLVSMVNIGSEVRQIVSGIAKFYQPEQLIGKKVVVVTNLKPIKIRGVESCGMLLAGSDDKILELPMVESLPNGTKIS